MAKRIGILVGDGPSEKDLLVKSDFTEAGLAVTRWPPEIFNNWTVTHIASGYAVAKKGDSREKAISVLRDLEPLMDWSRPIEEMRQDIQSLSDRIKRIVEKHGLAFSTGHPGKHSVKCGKKEL